MNAVWTWLVTHKALLSYPVGIIAAGLTAQGHKEAGAIVGLLATWLHGAGSAESDQTKKVDEALKKADLS